MINRSVISDISLLRETVNSLRQNCDSYYKESNPNSIYDDIRVESSHRSKVKHPRSFSNRRKHWYTDGEVEVFCHFKEKPEGFVKGRLTSKKLKGIR